MMPSIQPPAELDEPDKESAGEDGSKLTGSSHMPTHISDVCQFLQQVFVEERTSLDLFLEQKHSRLISELRGSIEKDKLSARLRRPFSEYVLERGESTIVVTPSGREDIIKLERSTLTAVDSRLSSEAGRPSGRDECKAEKFSGTALTASDSNPDLEGKFSSEALPENDSVLSYDENQESKSSGDAKPIARRMIRISTASGDHDKGEHDDHDKDLTRQHAFEGWETTQRGNKSSTEKSWGLRGSNDWALSASGKERKSRRGSTITLGSIVAGATSSFDNIQFMDRDLAIRRLQARIGYMPESKKLTPDVIYQSLQALTLDDICRDDIVEFVVKVSRKWEEDDEDQKETMMARVATGGSRSAPLSHSLGFSHSNAMVTPTIRFATFVDVLIESTAHLIEEFGESLTYKIERFRDILLQSDADCLVAELMNLRVDDISTPVPAPTFLELMEPIVGFVIMLNGVLIGCQTEEALANSDLMVYFELPFTVFFLGELLIKCCVDGVYEHFFGVDLYWNWFDFVVVLLAIIDTSLALLPIVNEVDTNTLTVLRLARLTRITRLIRIFRIKALAELTLMVKGLLGGLKTLFWAVVLLVFMLYVIGIFLTMMVGKGIEGQAPTSQKWEHERHVHFSTLPKSMFTAFRCLLIVDCVSTTGTPLLTEMITEFGWIVPACYAVCFITVSIGLMNLIMAIYIENTLNNAKQADHRSKVARSRESCRVAHQLKKLLVMFISAQKHRVSLTEDSHETFQLLDHGAHDQGAEDLSIHISRETFMLCLQHPKVQGILDDLDIPPERAHLFDQLNADSSGHLLPTELVNGLLKVRGETRRGDVVATLLAVRSLQNQMKQVSAMLMCMPADMFAPEPPLQLQAAVNDLRKSLEEAGVMKSNEEATSHHLAPLRNSLEEVHFGLHRFQL